jgi:hypothetical protein
MVRVLFAVVSLFSALGGNSGAWANGAAPPVAGHITEEILTVKTPQGFEQQGVLSMLDAAQSPQKLLVVVPGHPGVLSPRLTDAGQVTTRQKGNFLVRARPHLLSEQVAILLIDCRSDFETLCTDAYQASAQRAQDIALLVQAVKTKLPSIVQVCSTAKTCTAASFTPQALTAWQKRRAWRLVRSKPRNSFFTTCTTLVPSRCIGMLRLSPANGVWVW